MSLHDDALVIDGLVYHSDGDVADLKAGGVNAVNITVSHFEADFERACDEAARWRRRLDAPGSDWMQIETMADFDRAKSAGKVGAILGWQNTRPVQDELARLYLFRRLGFRIMQPTYNFRNAFGDGCLEPENGGLTLLGREAVKIMNDVGIAIDLSHVGRKTSFDVIALSTKPVLATHANAHALAPLERNKTDDMIRAIAETGGVIGASIYGPMCWDGDPKNKPTIDDYLRHVDYLAEVAGPEHVSFGTDLAAGANYPLMASERGHWRRWDGINRYNAVFGETIPDRYLADCNKHADLPKVTDALLKAGWSEAHVRGYLGENLRRALGQAWGES